ncbi:MAG: hypothetical protein H5T74_09705 [Actinobacteria bacterium]|nr:hypothetical protein [Actinomycetota bacterium]
MSYDVDDGKSLIGFLTLLSAPDDGGYLGALLVTDKGGIPAEFRCTLPVKPNAIQKPLYGEKLEPYIGVELCGLPLLQSISNTPSLIIVNKEYLLKIRENISYPLVFIGRAGEVIEVEQADGSGKGLSRFRVTCNTGRFQPIVCSPHPDFEQDQEMSMNFIGSVFSHLDLLEPFERIERAIEVLREKEQRFQ